MQNLQVCTIQGYKTICSDKQGYHDVYLYVMLEEAQESIKK